MEPDGNSVRRNDEEAVIWEMQDPISHQKRAAAISQGYGTEAMANESTRFPLAPDLNSDSAARELGLDETLRGTFPCSDALSAIPDPLPPKEST